MTIPCLITKNELSLVVFIEYHCSNISPEIDSNDPDATVGKNERRRKNKPPVNCSEGTSESLTIWSFHGSLLTLSYIKLPERDYSSCLNEVRREFCEILTKFEQLSVLFIESRVQTIFPALLCIPKMTCIYFLEASIEIQSNLTDSKIETS